MAERFRDFCLLYCDGKSERNAAQCLRGLENENQEVWVNHSGGDGKRQWKQRRSIKGSGE